MGVDHMKAAHDGTDEIGLAVSATTFSHRCRIAPVGFMPRIAGQWLSRFALTIAAAVLVSLFVSFSLDPMLSAYWADPQLEAHERRNPIAHALEKFNACLIAKPIITKPSSAGRLDHRWTMYCSPPVILLRIALQATVGRGGFVPVSDNSELNIAVRNTAGSSLDYTTLKPKRLRD